MAASRGIYTKTSSGLVAAANTGPTFLSDDASISQILNNPASGANLIIKALITAGIPPALASNPTVVGAAVSAVAQALTDASVVTGGGQVPAGLPIAFSVIDQANRRTWLEVGLDGRPTPESLKLIVATLNAALAAQTVTVSIPGSTPADVTAQVNSSIATAGVVTGSQPLLGNNNIALSFTGSEGRRSWVEIGLDGRPTPESIGLIVSALNTALAARQVTITGVPTGIADEANTPFAIVDSNNRVLLRSTADGTLVGKFPAAPNAPSENTTYTSDTATDSLGKTQIRTHEKIGGRTRVVTSSPTNKYNPRLTTNDLVLFREDTGAVSYVPATGGTVWPYLAIDRWACWGDSLTAGGWPQTLSSLLGIPVDNWGIGGQTSIQIAARQNGAPALLTLSGNSIPADLTPVTVTAGGDKLARPTDVSAFVPGPGVHNSFGITLAGVDGTISVTDAGVYSFARTTAGAVTPVPANTPAYTAMGTQAQTHAMIIMSGRNNYGSSAQIISDIQAMIAYSKPYQKRYQLINILPSTDDGVSGSTAMNQLAAANAALVAAFPGQVLDIATYLRSDQAFTDAGVSKTAQDTTDIGNGWTPTSFRADPLHLNTTGYNLVAKRVRQELITKGWAS